MIGWFFEILVSVYFLYEVDFKKFLVLALRVGLQKGWKRQLAHSLVEALETNEWATIADQPDPPTRRMKRRSFGGFCPKKLEKSP